MNQVLLCKLQAVASPWPSIKRKRAQMRLTIILRSPDPRCLLRLPAGKVYGQDLGCRQHGGWCAGQKVMSWLPYRRGGGQHSFHSCFSMAPDSSVPKSALAISNF